MQKANSLLLLIIAGLLLGLWLKPEARRYELFHDDYLLDTASGKVVMMRVSEGVKADIRAKVEEVATKKEREDEGRLMKTCPDILVKEQSKALPAPKGNLDLVQLAVEAESNLQRKECEEWVNSKAQTKPVNPANPSPR